MLTDSSIAPTSISVDQKHLPVQGGELYRRRMGGEARPGATVIVVHGGPGLSHEPLQTLDALATGGLTIIQYDQRGVGGSSGGVDETNFFSQAVSDLDAVRADADVGLVHLVGHARGALVAALYAGSHPHRVASLALIDSFPPTSIDLAAACERQAARVRDFQRRGLVPVDLPSLDDDGEAYLLAVLPAFFVDPRHPAARSLAGARFSFSAFRASHRALRTYDARATVAQVRAPSLHFISPVPYGSQMAGSMAAAIGGPATRLILRNAGHLAWLEQPQSVLPALASFFDLPRTTQTQLNGEQS